MTDYTKYTNRQMLKDIWSFVRPYKGKFWLGTLIRLTSDIAWLFPIWAISEIITFAADYNAGDPLTYFWQLTGAIIIVAIYHFIGHDLCKYFIYPIAERTALDAQIKTLQHLYTLDSHWQQTENSGKKIKRISKGGESLNKILRVYVDLVIESVVNVVGITIVFADLSWQHSVALIIFFITYYILSYKLTARAVSQAHKANLEAEEFEGVIFETVNNISTVKSLGIDEQMRPWLERMAKNLFKEIKRRVFYFRTRSGVLNLYQEVFRQGILIYTILAVFDGRYEVGVISLVLLYFGNVRDSAHELAETYNHFVIAKIGMQRMRELLDLKPEVELSGDRRFPADWQELRLEKVTFSYADRKVLDEVSLKIKRGEKVGIVGISGTGKSTLFKLLLKLHIDYEGAIKFDGVNLHDIERSSYIKHTAVVPQETELFNLSLQENIEIVAPERPGKCEALKRALAVAHVTDFLPRLKNGVKTLIGEKGIKLSGGERQRVGIARAVYREPNILFLDEATSHLDTLSEQKIQEALHDFLGTTTAIVIAHRLSTLQEMDRIVVLEEGKVVQEGSFADLQMQKGPFKKLWEQQS